MTVNHCFVAYQGLQQTMSKCLLIFSFLLSLSLYVSPLYVLKISIWLQCLLSGIIQSISHTTLIHHQLLIVCRVHMAYFNSTSSLPSLFCTSSPLLQGIRLAKCCTKWMIQTLKRQPQLPWRLTGHLSLLYSEPMSGWPLAVRCYVSMWNACIHKWVHKCLYLWGNYAVLARYV